MWASTKVGFPNTAYFLPVIYSLTGIKVETLEDLKKPLDFARGLLPPHVKGQNHLPYLGPLLDAGMAALLAFELEEALRYLDDPDFYLHSEDIDEDAGKIWLGAADDTVFRKRGVEFVDGTCFILFDGCDDVSDFQFQSGEHAEAASSALMESVFIDITPELQFLEA